MGISLLSLWLTLLWYPWPCSLKTKMFKSKSNLKHFINLLNFFLKNYFFCRKSISEPADGPWLKSIFFYSNGFLFWLRKKIMEHLTVLADIYSSRRLTADEVWRDPNAVSMLNLANHLNSYWCHSNKSYHINIFRLLISHLLNLYAGWYILISA